MTKPTGNPRGRPIGSGWKPNETEIKVIKRMAAAGMTLKMISMALGKGHMSIYRCEDAINTYHKGLAEAVTLVGESVMMRINGESDTKADTGLLAFVLKTRGGWKENDTFMNLKDFTGEDGEELCLEDKLKVIDKEFSNGNISVQNYKLLSDTVTNRIKVDMIVQDIEGRVKALEGK